jgi:hypothetical protein
VLKWAWVCIRKIIFFWPVSTQKRDGKTTRPESIQSATVDVIRAAVQNIRFSSKLQRMIESHLRENELSAVPDAQMADRFGQRLS